MDFMKMEHDFKQFQFNNEDDVKIHFTSEIVMPILREVNPSMLSAFHSENYLLAGGRTDATFQKIHFEYKKENRFSTKKGIDEALYGRDAQDHGLYDYLLSDSEVLGSDPDAEITRKITSEVGVGFDGVCFLFARFVPWPQKEELNTKKVSISIANAQNLHFIYEKKDFQSGLKRLALLLKQQEKRALTKRNLVEVFNPKSSYVRDSILSIYDQINFHLNDLRGSDRVRTLFREWDRVFGIMYGNDEDATDFTEVSSAIRNAYGIDPTHNVDSKIYLFSMQTFFNVFLKLLVYSFLSQLVDPTFTVKQDMDKYEINSLFMGISAADNRLVNNFFEAHFLEWFVFAGNDFGVDLVNQTLSVIDGFDLSTFVLRPENVQDILQEVYMELIPSEMRHLMGEYFSPDWIVEHALDMVGYEGDIEKKLIDPAAGTGPFITQAIKRVIKNKGGVLSRDDIGKITSNIVAFDINPISVVAAKANYILIVFSAYFENCDEDFGESVSIPVFIADSILAPVVYTEENDKTVVLQTSVGPLEVPKFESFSKGNEFLTLMSQRVHEYARFEVFFNEVLGRHLVSECDYEVTKKLFRDIYDLHMAGKNSFWPIVLKNSFAPIMIGDKFDYVVGNPPWIAWKSMSKSYREGTLAIWKSYGIFEKNAYDKKTTHDDFGMAVVYVAIDQYLKNGGSMVFLLPASFLKSTKGGEGFRKFEIIRKGQNIPFSVECVHDFSGVRLFTIPTISICFKKGKQMKYPMENYRVFVQDGRKTQIDSHNTWSMVADQLSYTDLVAQPVDQKNRQSAWLTLRNMSFANNVLNMSAPRFYKGRKGIEPAGAKGVYILKHPTKASDGYLKIENDMSRQRRQDLIDKGMHIGIVEEDYVFPMLGGRNISKWKVKSNEFILVPHTAKDKYGIPEEQLALVAPKTYAWLSFYKKELFDTRVQNGKFFNPDIHPFYRLDNVGTYTYAPFKVLWKEQTGSMSAVVVSSYYKTIVDADRSLFSEDKPIVVDSKVLMLALSNEMEAYFVCGIINSPSVTNVVDGYAIATNRGVDVLKYIAIPKYDENNPLHNLIACTSERIHVKARNNEPFTALEKHLDRLVVSLFSRKKQEE